jgi:hypothetical protein
VTGALRTLGPVIGGCLANGQTLRLDRAALRAMLAALRLPAGGLERVARGTRRRILASAALGLSRGADRPGLSQATFTFLLIGLSSSAKRRPAPRIEGAR